MADYLRTQIRNKIKEKLNNNVPAANNNIKFDDPSTLMVNEIPCILITSSNENITVLTIGYPRLQQRELDININCIVKSNINTQDKCDQIAKEVELVFSDPANKKLDGLCVSTTLNNVNFEFNDDLELNLGIVSLNYTILYKCYENAPDVAV